MLLKIELKTRVILMNFSTTIKFIHKKNLLCHSVNIRATSIQKGAVLLGRKLKTFIKRKKIQALSRNLDSPS